MSRFTDRELEAYLDELLAGPDAARLETALRTDQALRQRLAVVAARREGGEHTLGEIWRRERASCPPREEWGAFLLAALPEEQMQFLRIHLQIVGCRTCEANLADLERRRVEHPEDAGKRRNRFVATSAGHLKRKR
jgi:hypothetical protein